MKDDFIATIKSRGYWRVNFEPIGAPANLTLTECDDIVNKSCVRLRGWYYPFYGHGTANNHGIYNRSGYRQGWIDSGEFREFWNMYQSGQFLYYAAVHEDWLTKETSETRHNPAEVEPGKYIDFVSSLTMYITEIMEFLVRLHRSGLYQEGVKISISMINTKGRSLYSFDTSRYLSFPRTTQEESIVFEHTYAPEELDISARDLAIEPVVHFFAMFNMEDISVKEVIKKDQDKLYGFNPGG